MNAFHQRGGSRLVAGKNDPKRAALREVPGGQEMHKAGGGCGGGSPISLEFLLGEVTIAILAGEFMQAQKGEHAG